jgi:hypothetical protein
MDEARQVIARLERIEALRAAHAAPSDLVAELRELVRDGHAWLAAERAAEGDEPARGAEPAPGAAAPSRQDPAAKPPASEPPGSVPAAQPAAAHPPGPRPAAEPPGPVPAAAEPSADGNAALRAASALEALDRALAGGERRASSPEALEHEGVMPEATPT